MSEHILIIDDDPSYRRLLEIKLRSFLPSMTLVMLESINEARKYLDEHGDEKFDLVILDQHLKDGKGLSLLQEGRFEDLAVLSVSSDTDPRMPGENVKAGAAYFLNKGHINEALFEDLVRGIIDRNKVHQELMRLKLDSAVMDTVKTLVGTLRHEINNPLGAVLGAAYLLTHSEAATQDQRDAAQLVEASGKRIKHVLDELCRAVELEAVDKAKQKVFHIPGDKPWGEEAK